MKQILHFAWLPRYPARPLRISRAGPASKSSLFSPCKKSSIDQTCSVKMAEYWPRFLCVLIDREKRTWPISSHLDLTFGQ